MVGSAPRTHKSSTFKRKGTDFKGSQINRDNSLQRREEAPTARNPVSVGRAAPLSPTRNIVDAKSEYSGKSDGKSSRGTNQYQAFSGKKYLGKLTSPSI